MSEDAHSDGKVVGDFCAIRTGPSEKCKKDGNNYVDNCTPPPVGWATFTFVQGTEKRVDKPFEAHHVLCVACVTKFIADCGDLKTVVEQTKWCINAALNMFAMPLWGHTIKYYCSDFVGITKENVKDKLTDETLFTVNAAPLFQNIPMHDYDHNSKKGYKQEIDGKMKELADQVKQTAKEDHKAAVKELAAELDGWSTHFKAELTRRGSTRCGGTHEAWKKGIDEPDSDWYKPFSMADDDNEAKRSFPAAGGKSPVWNKIKALVDALGRWGAT